MPTLVAVQLFKGFSAWPL